MTKRLLLTRPTRFSAEPTTGMDCWGCLFLSPGLLGIDRETFPLAPSPFAVIQLITNITFNYRNRLNGHIFSKTNFPFYENQRFYIL